MKFMQLSGAHEKRSARIKRSALQRKAACSPDTVKRLADKEVLVLVKSEVDRIPATNSDLQALPRLSPAQERCLHSLQEQLKDKAVCLLQGLTGSGKTEVYLRLIQEQIEQGKDVLYMLPEIALTTQIIQRLQRYFGDRVIVYHSRFNQQERVEIWEKIHRDAESGGRVILGARSVLFMPFKHLGLVIVDEEHEHSFKQFDPAPRYHGRDSAIVLAGLFGAGVILGSATPCIESRYNADSGKYGFARIDERYGGVSMPAIELSLLNHKTAPDGNFTQSLLDEMGRALERDEQIILFQNRRGYAPVLICQDCGWAPECTRCDVSATYHKAADRLLCHYCGQRYNVPPSCPACGSHKLRLAGVGTERIEEELPVFFPDARIARLDYDSTRTKHAFTRIVNDFQDGEIDILVGTQMVSKGLDFDNVSVVGILNADLLLKYPEFRAMERAYQLITQVAGRAGRRKVQGRVLVQSRDPSQWLLQQAIRGAYEEVYARELAERKKFGYPPFVRLIVFTVKHRQLEMVDLASAKLVEALAEIFPAGSILGPEYPLVKRVKNLYQKNIMLKISPQLSLKKSKEVIRGIINSFGAKREFSSVRIVVDVDPQ